MCFQCWERMACLRIGVIKVGFRKQMNLCWDLLGYEGLRWKRVGRACQRRERAQRRRDEHGQCYHPVPPPAGPGTWGGGRALLELRAAPWSQAGKARVESAAEGEREWRVTRKVNTASLADGHLSPGVWGRTLCPDVRVCSSHILDFVRTLHSQ